jgi:hypothetical protein
VILRGDELVCFGRLENIRSVLYPPAAAKEEAAKPEPEKEQQERTSGQ